MAVTVVLVGWLCVLHPTNMYLQHKDTRMTLKRDEKLTTLNAILYIAHHFHVLSTQIQLSTLLNEADRVTKEWCLLLRPSVVWLLEQIGK